MSTKTFPTKYWATNEQCVCRIVNPVQQMAFARSTMVLCQRTDGHQWFTPLKGLSKAVPKRRKAQRKTEEKA